MDFIASICCFILGFIVFSKRVTNRKLLRWRIPRRMIIPLRTLLSITLFGTTIISICYGNPPDFLVPLYLLVLFLLPFINLILAFVIIAKVYDNQEKNWKDWWQNIVYASLFTLLIWLFSRNGFDFTGNGGIGLFILAGFPLFFFNIMFWRFITLYLSAKEKKNFKPIRYCLLSYFVLACLFFALGGYRNPERDYSIKESKEAEAFLWEYDVFRISKHIPEPLTLPIKYAYAERFFHNFKYDNDFTNKRLPNFWKNEYQINILFDKKFYNSYDPTIENHLFFLHDSDHNMYRLSRKGQDTIPPPDTVRFCFKYSLTGNDTIISDTLLLIKTKESKQAHYAMKLANKQSSDKKVVIINPEESFIAIEPIINGHKALTIINTSLKDFVHKEVFSWNLSIIFHFEDAEENGMPKDDGMERIQQFCEDLEKQFNKALGKPNALFTFRETYNGISHVTWRVYDSDITEEVLQKVIEAGNYPFEFEYRLEYDKEWEIVEWYLQDFNFHKD